ncbi:OLC1v1015804C1 [Oldenlandia corymbosa var. corymbosa]|uniref:OLC1v1015804C1 n=1 Tax=Oldenlandia corymbosa var. corymbosa TaxID=529605 RepID=A0AAV1E4D8_OLDCO|nr:OLC1v1015804C1 [Oldenlandia corymbosa var. corymbosa]
MGSSEPENGCDVAIIGGGIGGLATALALHRKGFQNVAVYEKSNSLRAEGTAIGIFANGWRALDQLGVGDQLRDKAVLIQGGQEILFDQDQPQNMPYPAGEARCVKRSDLTNALANALPPDTVRFGFNLVSLEMDNQSMTPVLQFDDGKTLTAKVVIGCDGSNSVVASFLGLKAATLVSLGSVRGLANYPDGHQFPPLFTRIKRDQGDGMVFGLIPIDDKLVYWFLTLPLPLLDGKFRDDPELIKDATLRMINGYPADAIEMVEKSDLDSLSFTRLRYRHPWEILVGGFRKGSVALVGDAMHVMGPFIGQGGSASLEDAVVLARNMAQKIDILDRCGVGTQIMSHKKIEEAFDQYVKDRRMRIFQLSTQTYLVGLLLGRTSFATKFIAVKILHIFFRDPSGHTKYDCGKL